MEKEHWYKEIPPRPAQPRSYSETDRRYWYDEEYAGWRAVKHPLPLSPGDGPKGKRLDIFCQGGHPYWLEYQKGAKEEAEKEGFCVHFHYADWDQEVQTDSLIAVLKEKPDMIIFSPVETIGGAECINLAYEAEIPIIGSNQVLDAESYTKIIAWAGPDDWGQQRKLARHFADEVKQGGGYCMVTHRPGTSVYLARTWGVISELDAIAPHLKLLDTQFTQFNREETRRVVKQWIETYGSELVGIVSADDSLPQEGINRALAECGREDIIRVANGATRRGLGFIRNGSLSAVTWQPPEVDGALAVKIAADWFKGFRIDPITYLPQHIITKENVDSFLIKGLGFEDFHGEDLCRMILEGNLEEIHGFFEDIKRRVVNEQIVGEEYFGGFAIQLMSNLLTLADKKGESGVELAGGYEMLYKGLFQQPTVSRSLDWLSNLAIAIVERLMESQQISGSLVDRLTVYIELHYSEAVSLKTLSEQFGLSAAYLGKVFKEHTGLSFSRYLNEYRITKAKELLTSGNMKAKEVAEAVGYADSSYFYTTFKKFTGTAPSDYITD
ncbi:MAG: substrate-binding domain-containing protein [Sphaerochaetaceae bacterium]|nr:substrate-binding domain-containing protein [Sphaerochaetaceae bacterium]